MKKISRLTALLLALLLIFQMTAVATEMSEEDISVATTPIPQEELNVDNLTMLSNQASAAVAAIDTVLGMGMAVEHWNMTTHLYENPKATSKQLATIPSGAFVVVYDSKGVSLLGEWYKICYNGQDGYVHNTHLTLCTCNVQEGAGLDAHADGCPDKMYYVSICALTVEEIAAKWSEYTEEGKAFILLYLSWHDQVKLAALQALIGPPLEEQQISVSFGEYQILLSGNLPVGASVEIAEVTAEAQAALETQFPVEELGLGGSVESHAFDLSIMVDGVKWQPSEGSVKVHLTMDTSKTDSVRVTHLLDSQEGISSAQSRGTLLSFTGDNLAAAFPREIEASGELNTVYYEQMTSEAGQASILEDGIEFELNSFSILQCTKIEDGLKDLNDNVISLDDYKALRNEAESWADSENMQIPIINWKRSSGYVNYTITGSDIQWNYSTVSSLTPNISADYQVWNGSRVELRDSDGDGTIEGYYSYNPSHYNYTKTEDSAMDVGQISAIAGTLYDSAVWNNHPDGDADSSKLTIYRLQGEFSLPKDFDMALWNYELVTRPDEGYLYINDDLYVFIYPKSAKENLNDENFVSDFFAYWGGTSARTEADFNRTFHGHIGQRCDREALEDRSKLAQVVDGWRVVPTTDNIGEEMRNLWALDGGKYKGETEYVIDVFVADYSGWGACYRPVIEITPKGKSVNTQAVCGVHTDNALEGAKFEISYKLDDATESQIRTDVSTENGYLDYSVNSDAKEITLSPIKDDGTPEGFEDYKTTTHNITLEGDGYKVDSGTEPYDKDNRYKLEFTPNTKYLKFEYNGGTDGTTTEGSQIAYCACGEVTGIVPTVTREGYDFGGWKVTETETEVWVKGTVYTADTVISNEEPLVYSTTGNTTLQAIWIQDVVINYEPVAFNAAGEQLENTGNSVSPASETVKVFAEIITGSVPSATENYHFVGWYKDAECTEPVDESWWDTSTGKIMPQKTYNYSETTAEALGYEAATYYAKFEYNLADLTIRKTGLDTDVDPYSSTMYSVVCYEAGVNMTVAIHGNSSVTIKDLPVGTYTVTELTDWSWRYISASNPSNGQVILDGDVNDEITFTNTRNKTQWLDSDCYAENTFDGSSSADRKPAVTN